MTSTTAKHPFHVELRPGAPDTSNSTPLQTFTGTLRDVAREVAETCVERATTTVFTPGGFTQNEPWLTFIFDPAPTKKQRESLTDVVLNAFQESEDGSWVDIEEGWDGERVSIAKSFEPGFSQYVEEAYEECVAGFWYDKRTFLFTKFDLSEAFDGRSTAYVSHWHPDSRCSGSWSNQYAIVSSRLATSWRCNDEDGYYVQFEQVDASTPAAEAATLDSAILGWYLYGAEYRLLDGYFLDVFESGRIGDLIGPSENPGYEIEDFSLYAESEVLHELRLRYPTPTKEEAVAWLEEFGHPDDMPEELNDSPVVQKLLEIVAVGESGAK